MARMELNDHDRYRISQARKALAAAAELDLSNDRALCRMLGRLEVTLSQLLDVIDEEGEQ